VELRYDGVVLCGSSLRRFTCSKPAAVAADVDIDVDVDVDIDVDVDVDFSLPVRDAAEAMRLE
jgi:hypothetical protein